MNWVEWASSGATTHKDISHLIIESTSGDNAFNEANIFSGTVAGYSLDTFGIKQGNSNPGIPPAEVVSVPAAVSILGSGLLILAVIVRSKQSV